MAAAPPIDRAQVLAYRVVASQLHRRGDELPGDLAVLDLGVQEYTPGSARVALAARSTAPLDDERLATVWGARGAPRLHRRDELPALAAALWPVNDADASTRIASPQIRDGVGLGLAAFTATARAFREVVTAPMPKGEVSTQVSALVPGALTYDCPSCQARHIAGNLFQHAGLAGGVRVESRRTGALLAPIDGWAGPPPGASGVDALITTYLRLLGPATLDEVAGYLGGKAQHLRAQWPRGLAEVTVDGRQAWIPPDAVDALRTARRPSGVRLLPAMDPLLQARDRALLVPDRERQKQIWRAIGNPGVLLHDGEIAGTWRAKAAGRRRVDVTVTPFAPLGPAARRDLEAEAAVVAAARDVPEATVSLT